MGLISFRDREIEMEIEERAERVRKLKTEVLLVLFFFYV